jgi:hypothetical protein
MRIVRSRSGYGSIQNMDENMGIKAGSFLTIDGEGWMVTNMCGKDAELQRVVGKSHNI